MPTASESLREEWMYNLDDEIEGSDGRACRFLEDRGYKLTHSYHWIKPNPEYQVTDKEHRAILFLIWEWDYGGIQRHANDS